METTTREQNPTTFIEAEVRLAESLPGYESRPQQQALATAVEAALATGTHLLGEAGTGVGKSLGYLIPAILSGKRVVISTATKALQGQLANKDLPFLQEHLGVPFTWAVLKGRSNYLCRSALADLDPSTPGYNRVVQVLDSFGESTAGDTLTTGRHQDGSIFLGERDDFEGVPARTLDSLTVSAEECPGKKSCPFGAVCFSERAKTAAQGAQVVVVNHALLLTDLQVREATFGAATLIGHYDAVVIDEGHELEQYASSAFGVTVTERTVQSLATEIVNFAHTNGCPSMADATKDVLGALTALWPHLEPGRIRQSTLLAHDDEWVALAAALHRLVDVLVSDAPHGMDEEASGRWMRLQRRAASLARKITSVVADDFASLVRWVEEETMRNGSKRLVLRAAPIDVAPILAHLLFDHTPSVVVSATLAVAGSFDYVAGRLGLRTYESIEVGTPFDYPSQARLFVPGRIPDPGKETRAWEQVSVAIMSDLIQASEGRALVLFTSTKRMRDAHAALSARLPYSCYVQGQEPNAVLADRFKAETNSVLFATRSFMTGVDFQGDTLSLVIVDKLPFPVPTEPIVEARCEAIRARGQSDFAHYVVPEMSLVLKQAVGRLIRHRGDRGIMAILDPRLLTKPYGRTILRSLPDAPRVEALADVESFFAEVAM